MRREAHEVLGEKGRERGPCSFEREVRGPHSFGGEEREPRSFDGGGREDHVALGCSLLPCGLGSRRDFAGKERGERTLAGGP